VYYDKQCTIISQITYRASTIVVSTFTFYIWPPHTDFMRTVATKWILAHFIVSRTILMF